MDDHKVYAVKLKDRNKLVQSSSGGAFCALSEQFIINGNAIVCTEYDYSLNRVFFKIVTSIEERDIARGTKYVQASMGSIYKDSVQWLQNNPTKKIMFFGLGCQAAAFQNYLKVMKLSDRVVIVDIICHGVPSPLIWEEYINFVSKGEKIDYVNFRDKKTGWAHSSGTAMIGGEPISIQEYRRIYSTRNPIRPSCFNCPYTKIERMADITIGDFWHIEKTIPDFYDPMGVSLVIVHSPIGRDIFDSATKLIDYKESNVRECMQMNLEKPTPISEMREAFWEVYRKAGIEGIIMKFGKKGPLWKRTISKIVRMISGQ